MSALALSLANGRASAQTATVAPHEVRRLDQALEGLAELGESSTASGVVSIVASGILIGGGAYLALHDTDDDHEDKIDLSQYLRGAGGGMLIAVGGATLVGGIGRIGSESFDTHRFRRFRAAAARGPMDVVTFARFEGDLLAQARLACAVRRGGAIVLLGIAFGGAGALALGIGATEIDDDFRLGLAAIGTGYVIYGLWQGLVLLNGESKVEQLVRAYVEDRERVRKPRSPRLTLTPAASPHAFGLTLRGQL